MRYSARNRHCYYNFVHPFNASIFTRKEIGIILARHYPTSPRDRPVHEVHGICRGERYCGTRSSLMSQPTPCATATNRAQHQDGTGRDGTGQDKTGPSLARYQDCKSGILFARYRGL